jgi:iron complex outermembrane receptor protein
VTRFDIGNGGQQLWNNQSSQELRLTSPLGAKVDYQVGLYGLRARVYSDDPTAYGADAGAFNASNAQYAALSAPQYRGLLRASQDGVYRSYVLEPRTTSLAAFGQLNWHVDDKATITAGLRETHESKKGRNRRELDRAGSALTNAAGSDNSKAAQYGLNLANAADLAAWNAAKALYTNAIGGVGGIYDWKEGQSISSNSLSWLLSPSYKLGESVLLYASASQGEKSGAVEFVTASGPLLGTPQNVRPEKARDYELGVKSVLFNRRLLLNANIYQTKVTDYQANLTVEDPTSSSGTRTYLGNIPGVRARGLELEANFAATRNLNLNLNASYNRAIYLDFTTAAPDTSVTRIVNFAGRQLHGAPKVIVNAGLDYSQPLGRLLGRVFINNAYRSGSYLASSQSEYTYQRAYSVTDAGISIGGLDGRYEFQVVAKNLFDKSYATGSGTYSSSGAVTVQPAYGRALAAVFRSRI